MSARTEIADKLKTFLMENSLGEVYGIIEGYGPNKRYRSLTFCRARSIDGEIRIYGAKFIVISWMTTYNKLPRMGNQKVDSVEKAIQFMTKAFVNTAGEMNWKEYE
ncbi:MAG: hypothetical protein CMB80_02140 [Flammeovirgaceae bacterium]|nr:hypothetical protein [Flammeovirgaceae bacterium]|tara:strand:- start:444 stop:761 length:318 start_codon:yes stop_codon:yes gene_type:complete